MPQCASAPAVPVGRLLCKNLAASVLVLGALPWLNPFTFGPVASVLPWLFSAFAALLAVLASSQLVQWREPVMGPSWSLRGALALLVLALWPRDALLPTYEALALAGALVLVGLGAALACRLPPATAVGGLSWSTWCALLPWAVAAVASSVLALVQYFGHAGSLSPWVNWALPGEAFANLRQRNQFASLTNIALGALLAYWLLSPRRLGTWRTAGAMIAAALLVAGNAAAASRTGLLQLVVLAGIALLWRRDARTLGWLAWMLGGYVVATFVLPWAAGLDPSMHGMFSRLRTGDALCSSRLTLWRNVLDLIAQRPWLGWGWGELDYAHYMTLYEGPRFCDILDNAHNLPLHLAVELGVPAALLFCAVCLWAVIVQRPWRETDPLRQMAWMVLAVIALHSLLEYPLWYGPFQLACGLSLGLLWRGQSVRRRRAVALPLVWAGLLLGACFYAAWDYRRISQIYLPPAQRLPQYQDDTLAKIKHSWLFRRQVQFAELSISTVTPENAAHIHALASALLHFSPEAKLVEKLLDAALVLGYDEEVRQHRARFEAAFPEAYARWVARQGLR